MIGGGNFPSEDMRKRIETLIRPVRDPSASSTISLIPLWESRTRPLLGAVHEPTLGVVLNDLSLRTRRSGESVFIETQEQNLKIDEILLDFALLRESLATVANYPGKTELSVYTAPRLERVRAASLKPKHIDTGANLRVLVGSQDFPLIAGNVFDDK